MWWPCPHYPLLQWLYGGRLVALKVSWQKQNIELQAGTFGVWNTFSCHNKKPTPSNLIGSMMIIRVLPIHVPRMLWGGDTLSLLHWNHIWLMMIHLVWPIHVPRNCEPLMTPHLSLWGNARTRATFPTHKKNHNPHPQGGGGKGVKMGTLHWVGVGVGPAKPGSYIYIYIYQRNFGVKQLLLWALGFQTVNKPGGGSP